MRDIEWHIGIDEVGRGPLAGPVAVGVVLVPADFDWALVPGVTDSKQLSEGRRSEIAAAIAALPEESQLRYAVAMTSARVIDQIGIVPAIQRALNRGLTRCTAHRTALHHPLTTPIDWSRVLVKLDGGLRAPEYCCWQETIIKGDAREPVIGAASIVAKVARDTYMCRIAKRADYSPYNFAAHKGYGTQAHRTAIATHGLSPEHRCSYCRNIVML